MKIQESREARDELHRVLDEMEVAASSGNQSLLKFWRRRILKRPMVLHYFTISGYLGFLIGKARELIAPDGETTKHLISSVYYWQSQLAEGIYFKFNGGRTNPEQMAEEEPHEQILAQIVKETITAIRA